MRTLKAVLVIMFFVVGIVQAQHEHHRDMQETEHTMEESHQESDKHASSMMSSSFLLSVPMTREASGTSWLPDNSPMYGAMYHAGNWMLMLHGNIFPRYTATNITNSDEGLREGRAFDAPNWIMLMAYRPVGDNGQFMARAMLSADRWTEGGNGYPLLFQTGETWQGKALIDRQHPHDLVSELSVGYSHRIGEHSALFAYFGMPGEPALGPPAFMHRTSALNMPDAPLGHHWQDATHIVFGVATLGVHYGDFKLDASIFTGREPDENRYNFDKPLFDSYSARLSMNPDSNTALQVSYGFLHSPEIIEPGVDVHRATASVLYHYPVSMHTLWANTLVWGVNSSSEGDHTEHSFLLESDYQFSGHSVFTRIEAIQKDGHELGIEELHDKTFWIPAISLGGAAQFWEGAGITIAIGAQATLYSPDEDLQRYYGSTPLSAQVFLRIRPSMMSMNHM